MEITENTTLYALFEGEECLYKQNSLVCHTEAGKASIRAEHARLEHCPFRLGDVIDAGEQTEFEIDGIPFNTKVPLPWRIFACF